jgi:lipoate-protein ligase A
MKIIQLDTLDAYFNLALEEYVFFHLVPVEDYFLLWQNQNAVVIGKHQNPIEEINLNFVESNQVQVARRISGGGAVYHDLGNLNYSIIVHSDEMRWDIKKMADPIIKALEALGVNIHLNKRNDLLIDGKKISGSSQYIKGKRLLHHGTLLFNSDLKSLSLSLKPGDDRIESRSIKSVRSPVTNINDHYPKITIKEFTSKLREVLAENSVIEDYELTDSDLEAISALREEKYSTWEWIYGRSPEYSIRKERGFNGNVLEISLMVKNGAIQSLKLDGDFIGTEVSKEVEECLKGVRMIEGEIASALSTSGTNQEFGGICTARIARMIAR